MADELDRKHIFRARTNHVYMQRRTNFIDVLPRTISIKSPTLKLRFSIL